MPLPQRKRTSLPKEPLHDCKRALHHPQNDVHRLLLLLLLLLLLRKVLNGNVCLGFNEGAVRVWSFRLLPIKSDQTLGKDEPLLVSPAGSPLSPTNAAQRLSGHPLPSASSKLKPTGAAGYLADMLAARCRMICV